MTDPIFRPFDSIRSEPDVVKPPQIAISIMRLRQMIGFQQADGDPPFFTSPQNDPERHIRRLLPPAYFDGRTVVPVDLSCLISDELRSIAGRIGIIRWSERSADDLRILLDRLLNASVPTAYVNPKWLDCIDRRRIYMVFDRFNVITIVGGTVDGVRSDLFGIGDYYKNSMRNGRSASDDCWYIDDIEISAADYLNYIPFIDLVLEPFLLKPIRQIVRGYFPVD